MTTVTLGLCEDSVKKLKLAIQSLSETTELVISERQVIPPIPKVDMMVIGTRIHERLAEVMSQYEEEMRNKLIGMPKDFSLTTISIEDLNSLPSPTLPVTFLDEYAIPHGYNFEEEDKRDIHFKPFARFINQPIGKRRRRK